MKPLPKLSLELTLHPERDANYEHFRDGAKYPFEARASVMTRRNAWWLADAALLSYWPNDEAVQIFENAGLAAKPINAGSTNVYVATAGEGVIVAFRGTQPDEWHDTLDDVDFEPEAWASGGKVHGGFKDACDRAWSGKDGLEKLLSAYGNRPVWFCGHSLGGAIATLAATRWAGTAGVCTIGSPRVGDDTFVAQFNKAFANRSWRFVNDHDIVTHLPPPRFAGHTFAHVGAARYIGDNGLVSTTEPEIPHYFENLFGSVPTFVEHLQAMWKGVLTRGPQMILDHMPSYYSTAIWNDFELNG